MMNSKSHVLYSNNSYLFGFLLQNKINLIIRKLSYVDGNFYWQFSVFYKKNPNKYELLEKSTSL